LRFHSRAVVSQRTGIINQIRAFLLERGVAVRHAGALLASLRPSLTAEVAQSLSTRPIITMTGPPSASDATLASRTPIVPAMTSVSGCVALATAMAGIKASSPCAIAVADSSASVNQRLKVIVGWNHFNGLGVCG
jgi:hypothetical protein